MNQSSYLVWVYGAYAAIAAGMTIWLARTLFRSGGVFLAEVFEGRPELASAVNKLLVVGFYLINLGFALLWMKAERATSAFQAIEVLAYKLGALLLILGVAHFFNLYLFYRIRQRRQLAEFPPPVAPHLQVEPGLLR